MCTRIVPRLLAAAVLVAAPAAARGQLAIYTDLAAFLAATANAGTDRFDDLAGAPTSPMARSAGDFTYLATTSTTEFFAAGSAADRWLSVNTATDVVTFSGFAPSVRGVGGLFFGSDIAGLFRPGTSITVRVVSAEGAVDRTLVDATTATFLGFVSGSPFVSLTVAAVIPPADLAWPTVNDLVLAQAAPANVVPEPTTVVLVGVGVAGLALAARRHRQA